jgi:hypothetical protein
LDQALHCVGNLTALELELLKCGGGGFICCLAAAL